ncbi:MAG: hypothetical protein JSR58_02995 [Verrucomicrobia bacterium]|nr:hypothetical protein [Verrucomicrobiota bacterium]
MKKIGILFLIAAMLGTYLLVGPFNTNPVAKTVLSAELTTEPGRAAFAKKLQPHLDAFAARWQKVEALQKEVNERILAYQKEPSDALKSQIEERIAVWKKATDEVAPFVQLVEAGQNALAHPDKVVALALELKKKGKLADSDMHLLEKVAEICKE